MLSIPSLSLSSFYLSGVQATSLNKEKRKYSLMRITPRELHTLCEILRHDLV